MSGEHGHIKLSRKMFRDDPFWNEDREFSRAEAWIDLIEQATWKHRREKVVQGDVVTLHRGELLASERYLARRWNWSRGRVRRYLGKLVDMGRIAHESDHPAAHLGARITLCNYDSYQSTSTGSGPPTGPETDQPRTTGGPKRRQDGRQEETTSSTPRAKRETDLRDFLGDYEDAVDLMKEAADQPDTWPAAVMGLYGPSGTWTEVWGGVEGDERGRLLSAALTRFAGEENRYNNLQFKRFLERVIDDYRDDEQGDSDRTPGRETRSGLAGGVG